MVDIKRQFMEHPTFRQPSSKATNASRDFTGTLGQEFWFEPAWQQHGGLIKTQTSGPHPRVSDSVGLGWGLGLHFLGSSQAIADQLTTPGKLLLNAFRGKRWKSHGKYEKNWHVESAWKGSCSIS